MVHQRSRELRLAKEIEPGLIRVDMSDDDDASAEETQEGVDQINHVLVYITREELRSVSWTEFNVFDDTVPEVLRSQ